MAHIIFLLKVQTILKQLYMKPHNLYMDRMKEIFFLMNKWLLWKNVILTKHRWFIHYQIKKSAYGCEKEDMGYVPFVMESLDSINLKCSKEKFTFPYKFKHGVVMEITGDEYERIKKHKWINKK